jgi:hypothetical protein
VKNNRSEAPEGEWQIKDINGDDETSVHWKLMFSANPN